MADSFFDIYTLPTIEFVGGETEKLFFNMYYKNTRYPFDLEGCEARFSVISYLNRYATPILSKDMEIAAGETCDNVLKVILNPSDTVQLNDKYIYQITVRHKTKGIVDIPKQGILYIINNIDKTPNW